MSNFNRQQKSVFTKLVVMVLALVLCNIAWAQYFLPFPEGRGYTVTQGWDSDFSHNPNSALNRYAVDFNMAVGDAVAAVAGGTVIRSSRGLVQGNTGGCGIAFDNYARYVVIDHGGDVASLYLHLNSETVGVGDRVEAGQIIGTAGATGYVCGGAHLHFAFQRTSQMGSSRYAPNLAIGFAETNGRPIAGRYYISRNSAGIPGTGWLVNFQTGYAVDAGAIGNIYLHGRPISNNPWHLWQFRPLGGGIYNIVSAASNRVLDSGGNNGLAVYLHPNLIAGNPYHQWRIESYQGGHRIRSVATGRVLDCGLNWGAECYLHDAMDNNAYQTFQLKPHDGIPVAGMLISKATNRALDSGFGDLYMQTQLNATNPHLRWRFVPMGNNEYAIISTRLQRVLDAGGANGGAPYLHPTLMPNNPYHRWRITPYNGGYMIQSVATGRVLDSGGSNGGSAYMHPTPGLGGDFHTWRLLP